MKEKQSNSVTHFEPESICDGITAEFTCVVDSGKVTVNGTIRKNGKDVGDISCENDSFLITRLKPLPSLTEEEIAAVYAAVPEFIKELI